VVSVIAATDQHYCGEPPKKVQHGFSGSFQKKKESGQRMALQLLTYTRFRRKKSSIHSQVSE
jgi:hypothetical protein